MVGEHKKLFNIATSCMDMSSFCYFFRYQASWCKQFRILFYRAMLSAKRDKMVSVIRIMQSLVSVLYNCSCIWEKENCLFSKVTVCTVSDHTLTWTAYWIVMITFSD